MRGPFQNEPGLDFSVEANRYAMLAQLEETESQLGRRYPIVIDGKRIQNDSVITSRNPGNLDQIVGEVARGNADLVDKAIQAAAEAFKSWKKMSAEGRASVAFKMAALLRRDRLMLAAWMVFELDKAWDEADGEVAEAIDMMEWSGRQVLQLAQPVDLASCPTKRTPITTCRSA